jgi:hypothetical protein
MTTTPPPSTLVIYNVPEQEVRDCNVIPFIERMAPYVINPEPFHADTFAFLVDGFNDQPDEIYTIPEVRAYWQEVDRRWPYILFFGSVLAEMPQMVAWCNHNNLSSFQRPGATATMINYDRPELLRWLHQRWEPMNGLFHRAYGNTAAREHAIYQRTSQIFGGFGMQIQS